MLPIIAIDGVSGSGKSSTARLAAQQLGFCHIDTGAMYRMVTWLALQRGLTPRQNAELGSLAAELEFSFADDGAMRVNGKPFPPEIRSTEVSAAVSAYCQPHEVREAMVAQQRKLGGSRPSVLEGRDIGTVVFPDARWKFYMTANPETRAERRLKELQDAGISASYDEILMNLRDRDAADSGRKLSPLKKAAGAVEIDTSGLTLEEQISIITDLVRRDLG